MFSDKTVHRQVNEDVYKVKIKIEIVSRGTLYNRAELLFSGCGGKTPLYLFGTGNKRKGLHPFFQIVKLN